MSKIFYDHILELEELERAINGAVESHEEKIELWKIVDEMIHHNVFGCLLDNLPREHHEEFLDKFYQRPYDDSLIEYLNERIQSQVEELIKSEVKKLTSEILEEIKGEPK